MSAGTRLSSVSSQDSGFTSQDTLVVMRMNPRGVVAAEGRNEHNRGSSNTSSTSSNSSTPLSPYPPHNPTTATWPNLQETMQFIDMNKAGPPPDRPHTISTALSLIMPPPYERGRQRTELSPYTFHPLESIIQGKSECESVQRGQETGLTSLLRQRSGSQSSQDSTQDKTSSVVPHPVYMNAAELMGLKPQSEYGICGNTDYSNLHCNSQSDSGLGDASPPPSEISEPCYVSTASIRRKKYAMRARSNEPVMKPALLPRPGNDIYRSVVRRSNSVKPPPPARSTSISSSLLDSIEGSPTASAHIEDLPLPPPPGDFVSEVDCSTLPPPPPEFLMDGEIQRTLSVAECIKSLTVVNHQPVSPNMMRRSQSVRLKNSETSSVVCRARNSVQLNHARSQSHGRNEGSPKVQRKSTLVEPPRVKDGNWLMNRPDPSDPDSLVVNKSSSLLAKTSFLESLNSKLQQQLSQTDGFPKPKPNQMEVLSKPVPIDFNPVNEIPLCDNEYAQRSHDLASRV
ncbi:hypothetical protein QYM36_001975, partial [Artemia franciscana]